MYSTIPKSRECLIINCAMNVTSGSIPGFYIFRGEKIKDDYIVLYKPRTHYMAIQTKTWIHDKKIIQKTFVIFQKVNPKWYLFKQPSSINYSWTWFAC